MRMPPAENGTITPVEGTYACRRECIDLNGVMDQATHFRELRG